MSMTLMVMRPWQQEARARRAARLEESSKAKPCPEQLAHLENRERNAMQALILTQICWGPYLAVADLWLGGDLSGRQEPGGGGGPRTEDRPLGPLLMAAE